MNSINSINIADIILNKFIGKTLKIKTKNNRIFEGKLMCVDYKCNLILH